MKHIHINFLLRSMGILSVLITLFHVHTAADNELTGIPGAFAPVDIGAQSSALAGAQTADPHPTEVMLFNPA